ncbi:MAG: NAD(P)H-dependent oxidoreductase [Flavobacteriales bacterium]
MKHLIIYTHFNPNSFTKAVCKEITSVLEQRNQEVKTIDLYADEYNPVLQFSDVEFAYMGGDAPEDTAKYQELMTWADHLIFVFPLWWYQMPAVLKGFLDRTLTNGFAFKFTENDTIKLLSDKKTTVFINAGSSEKLLEEKGLDVGIDNMIKGIFGYCGMQTEVTVFKEVLGVTQEVRENYLKEIKTII